MSRLPITTSYLDEDPGMGVDRNSHLGDVDVDLERQGEVASSSSTSSVDGSREEGLLGSQVVEGAYNLEVEA